MNAKTLEAIKRHGETLLAMFPGATERDPVTLCKKLRRIETATNRAACDWCNGDTTEEEWDKAEEKALARLETLLGDAAGMMVESGELFCNSDPRGYALKIRSEFARRWNHCQSESPNPHYLHTDLGGYGILAPDLTQS